MPETDFFIVYNHIDQFKSKSKKWQVQSYQNARRSQRRVKLSRVDLSARARRPPVLSWQQNYRDSENSDEEAEQQDPSSSEVHDDRTRPSSSEPHSPVIVSSLQSLRRDPFDALPVQGLEGVQITLDYFTQEYAPAAFHTCRDNLGRNALVSVLFKLSLESEVLFEANMLHMLCQLSPGRLGYTPKQYSARILRDRHSLIQKIQRRLNKQDQCSDDMIMTLSTLMVADMLQSQDDALEAHYGGMSTMVALRGGIKALPPFVQLTLVLPERMCDFVLQGRDRKPTINATLADESHYPQHPFSPQLTQALSAIPEGFGELALDGLLSERVILLLEGLSQTIDHDPETIADVIILDTMRSSMNQQGSSLERAIGTLSLLFFLLLDAEKRENDWEMYDRVIRAAWKLVPALQRSVLDELRDVAGLEFAIWGTVLIILAKRQPTLTARREQNDTHEPQGHHLSRLLLELPDLDLRRIRRVVQRYFWHKSFDSALAKIFDAGRD